MTGLWYDILTATSLSLAAVLSAILYVPFGGSVPVLSAVTIFCTAFCVIFRRLKAKARIALLGSLAAVLTGVWLAAERESRRAFAEANRWILAVLLLGILCVLFSEIAKRHPLLRLIPAAGGCAVLLVALVRGIRPGKGTVLAILFFLVLTVVELLQLRWKKEGDTDPAAHLVYLLPFLALLFLATGFLKTPDKPYDWQFVKNFAKEVRAGVEVLVQTLDGSESWDNGEAEVGFSDNARFHTSIAASPYRAFRITSTLPKGTGIYLAGKHFDTFDGRSWTKQDDSGMDYRTYDALETAAAIISYDPEHVRDYFRKAALEIDCVGARAAYVFTPEKSLPDVRGADTVQLGGDLVYAGKKRYDYRVDFYRLNRDYEGFSELVHREAAADAESLGAAEAMLFGKETAEYTPEGLVAYRNRVYEVYGEDPQLSAEASALLAELLDGAADDYEKLERIEAFLSGMTYTVSPGELPPEVDSPAAFLDALLFHTRQGYCTHFATAFVLLSRAAGIPARYVKGYCFAVDAAETEVLSDRAHAWAEAYLPGVGWVGFEPTPGQGQQTGWTVTEDDGQESREPRAYEDYAAKYGEAAPPVEDADTVPAARHRVFSEKAYIPVFLAVLFLAVFLLLDLLLRRYRYRHMSDHEKVRYLKNRNMRYLKRLGLSPAEGETLAEFAARSGETVPAEMLLFIGAYEEILYGGREATGTDTELFEKCRRGLLKLRRNRRGRKKHAGF